MKKEKQICTFDIKNFNQVKRTGVQKATRESGGTQKGQPQRRDNKAPQISNITASNITQTGVTITWNTNEESKGSVQYGSTTAYGSTIQSVGSTFHSVTLTDLIPGTIYNFRILSTDLANNTAYSSNQTFQTTGTVIPVIYLEFYGTTVANTLWNTNGTFTVEHSGLTEEEVSQVISAIINHFEQFNVIVTTDLTLYNNTPVGKKVKIIFTESNEWYSTGVGGVAYLNSFGWVDQSPAFVFTKLLNYNVHNISEAGAHEAGHTLGCRHQIACQDGVKVSEYNWGDGVTAPIMGVSYGVPSGDWWVGPCPLGCSVIQDDVQIITAKIGLKQQ